MDESRSKEILNAPFLFIVVLYVVSSKKGATCVLNPTSSPIGLVILPVIMT